MKRVIVIDDSKTVAAATAAVLESAGLEVSVATDPSALAQRMERKVDLYLVDVNMPEMRGDVLTRRLKAAGARTPILLYSDAGEFELQELSMQTGAAGYICKEWDTARIVAEVFRHLSFHDVATMPPPAPHKTKEVKRILILDDSLMARTFLSLHLSQRGYETETASEAHEFEAAITTFGPQVVIADVMMPGVNGDELCRRLKQRTDVFIPVILFSSLSQEELAKLADDCGADKYISKDHGPDELVELLDALLEEILW